MSPLFYRLFFGFWLTTLVAILASYQLGKWLDSDARPGQQHFEQQRRQHRHLLREAQQIYLHQGQAALLAWLNSRPANLEWLLEDRHGELGSSGERARQRLQPLIAELTPQRPFLRRHRDNHLVLGRWLRGSHPAASAKLMLALPRPHPLVVEMLHQHLWLRLLLAMVATGLVSFWLVRRYTRPIATLRSATRQLAAGELDTRLPDSGRSDEIAQLTRDFNSMTDQLNRARQQQRQLIRDVSHELRSPLARIQAALALAQRKTGEQPELERIGRECEQLNEMIDQLLSNPQRRLELNDTVDLCALLQTLVDSNQLEAGSRSCRLRCDSDVPSLLVRGAARELHSALENLLRNALRHTVENSEVLIRLDTGDPAWIRLQVIDHGPGVPEEELASIFLPFYRLDSARARDSGGYGLGLSIVQRHIEAHGGRVSAANTGSGLAVTVLLPRELVVDETPQ